VIASAAACVREPLPEICPNVDEGELVISELRGDQSATNTYGHYVEIYNAAGKTVDLQGLHLRLTAFDGEVLELSVRDPLEVEAGDYAVIGPGLPEDHAAWIDYAIAWDMSGGDPEEEGSFPDNLMRYGSAFVEIEACDELIDEVVFDDTMQDLTDGLPGAGTLACGNAENPPRAADNDDAQAGVGCWCVDDLEDDQGLFGVGLPGSPGEANRCP
jgi:hypothetical protein